MDFLKKLPGTLLALAIYYILPLTGNIGLFLHWQIWIPVIVCSVVYLTQPSTSSGQIKNPEDKNSMLFLVIATSVSQISVLIEWGYFNKSNDFTWDLVATCGAFLMLLGLVIRLWSIRLLGKYFGNDVRILSDHQLIQSGPYAYIRHPSYTGAFLVAVGIAIFLHTQVGILISVIVLLAAYSYRIHIEEISLVKGFGNQYNDYQKRTQRLIPIIW